MIANELATNAIKHAFPKGRGEINLGFHRRDGEVTLTVSDNGSGLASKVEGSGLGSRFVEAFVKQLGGTLATANSPKGTTFTVRLPTSILAAA
ncbi:sensor histidine kinase [Rhizobium sp. L245/93]|uniref:sensor histidine kinase n=1 Tax=Rhizobium sp. L245/93 TaxID=2819998 RepID=UPI001FFE1B88|nr:sensor histidine kinase [Rhizobium sp. L245/93]